MKLRFMGVVVAAGLLFLVGCGGDNVQQKDRKRTRTAIAAFTPTPTETATETQTATVTETGTATNTPTPAPPTPTPTITPTGNVTPVGTPLGEREFTVSETMAGMVDVVRTGLFTTALPGSNAASEITGSFVLVGGIPDANGVASLRLREDAQLAFVNPVSVVCFRLLADTSTGSIDCNGGTAYDATITQGAGPDAAPATLTTGIGKPAGTGAAHVILMQESVQLELPATPEDCLADDLEYDPPTMAVYTTEMITATKGEDTITGRGEPFSCAQFRDTDTVGMLVTPSVAYQELSPGSGFPGDVANFLRVADSSMPLPTPTPGEEPTPTPSTGPGGTPLGVRSFTIAETMAGMPTTVRTGLFTSALPGSNAASVITGETIPLVGGIPDANGVASLRLQEDTVIAFVNPVSVVCFRLLAETSSGSIDCDGGTPYDVTVTQDPGPDAPPLTLTTGVGSPAGPGSAHLLLMQESVQLELPATPEDCLADDLEYDPAVMAVYTTATITATKGPAMVTGVGEPFSCDQFAQSDTVGMLVNPSVAYQELSPGSGFPGNVANYLRLADTNTP